MDLIKKSFVLLTLLSSTALAEDSYSFRMASGIANSEKSALYSVGYENQFSNPFVYKLDFGAWTAGGTGQRSSPFSAFLLGARLGNYDGFHLQPLAGVVVIGHTDELLGSNFQFTEELAVGFKNVSLGYKHFSNAGIIRPNIGRDYLFLNFNFTLF